MLVYLDNADLAWLQRLALTDRSQFETFQGLWQDLSCELCLSFNHVQEIAQLADLKSIEARLDVIDHLGTPGYSRNGSMGALDLEIGAQLMARITGSTAPRSQTMRDLLFPPSDRAELEHAVLSNRREIIRHRKFLEACTEATNTMKATSDEFRQMAQEAGLTLPKEVPADFDWDAFWTAIETSTAGTEVSQPQSTFGLLRRGFSDLAKREGSVRKALETLHGLKGAPIASEVHDANLARAGTFFRSARGVANDLATQNGLPPDILQTIVPDLNPFECKGFRIQLAVERARCRTPVDQAAGDLIDVEHVIFAPYVDVLFVDKRTLHYAKTEIGTGADELEAEELITLRRGGSLEKVSESLAGALSSAQEFVDLRRNASEK